MGKPVFEKVSPKVEGKTGGVEGTPEGNIVFTTDNLAQGDRQDLFNQMLDQTEISQWEGHVEDGFSLDAAGRSYLCPKCDARTQQHYAQFIYATQIAPRAMFAPAGYFCTECPTVIVDEEMIRSSLEAKFKFQGVLGIDIQGRKQPNLFKTWNGERTLYIFDDRQRPVGMETMAQEDALHEKRADGRRKARTHKKRKKTMAKRSRKQNRRKK